MTANRKHIQHNYASRPELYQLKYFSFRYWIFESWGRISTLIGSNRLTSCDSLDDACAKFRSVFMEKCGNEFGTLWTFKRPGKYYHLNVDFEITKRKPNTFIESKLDKPVYDLMEMIFDTKHMKKTMSYDLDLKKMPLGQLRYRQIKEAMSVLRRIEKLITDNGTPAQLRNASNEFYTLIPHGFSIKRPTIIDSIDVVKAKAEMLEGLSNMQTIYGFFQGNNGEKLNPMDACYEKITTDIKLLDKNAPEFAKIGEIVQKTHGATHSKYTLQVVEVFKLKRKREDVRSRKYKKLDRQMLWHGSKLINFVSILSKGLRIAPKEAPSTGYMFGKGMYFADIVSKSANYCSQKDNTGLLLLCDVALGKSKSVTYAHKYDDIPNENEQSVKAFGATYPTEYATLDGIKVATGGLRRADFPTGLHYNEYVVYDIAQVKMKYLVKVKFNYK